MNKLSTTTYTYMPEYSNLSVVRHETVTDYTYKAYAGVKRYDTILRCRRGLQTLRHEKIFYLLMSNYEYVVTERTSKLSPDSFLLFPDGRFSQPLAIRPTVTTAVRIDPFRNSMCVSHRAVRINCGAKQPICRFEHHHHNHFNQ